MFSAQVTAKNSSSAPYANVRAILKSFAPGNVSVVSPSGFTGENLPFLDFGSLGAGESKTLSWKFYAPDAQPFTFSASALSLSAAQNTLALSSVSPSSFANNVTTSVTLQGAGIRQETAFFIESTRLAVSSWSATSATVSVPYGFLPGSYGIMAVNPDGTRAVLYPALTLAEGPAPRAADPRERAFSFADGFVLNYNTKQGIAGAKITAKIVAPGGVQTLSATSVSDGYYLLRGLPVGTHQVKIEAPGFEPVYRTAVITDPGTDPTKGATVHLKYAALEPSAYQTTYIGAAGGTHYASDQGENGPFLVIPPGALDQDTPIRFTHLRAAETLPELPQDGYYLAFARLEPVGLTFKKPATLYLPLQDGIKLTNGTPIKISYFDARENRWVQDITAGTIVTRANGKQYLEYEINHFTWIGGQWSPDPVSGCVKYASGGAAAGVQTSYGVTNGAGCYSGSTTSSDIGRTLTSSLIGVTPPVSVTFPYSGSSPVRFPDLTLPDPAPMNVATATPKSPCDGTLAGYSIPGPGFSAQSIPTQPASSTVSSQSTSLSSQSFNTTEKTLLVSSSTYGFTSQVFGGAFRDPSTIRVTLDGQDVTATVNITPTSSTSHTLDYQLDKPLKSGLGRRIEVSAGIGSDARVVGALEADVINKYYVPRVVLNTLPSGVSLPTPIISDLGKIIVITTENNFSGVLPVSIPITLLDENNSLIPTNSSRPAILSITSQDILGSKFENGVGYFNFSVNIEKNIKPMYMEVRLSNSGDALRSLKAQSGGTCLIPIQSTPDYNRPLIDSGFNKYIDEAGIQVANNVFLIRDFGYALNPKNPQIPFIRDNDPFWNNYMKSNSLWAKNLSDSKWLSLLNGDLSVLIKENNKLFENNRILIDLNKSSGSFNFVFNSNNAALCYNGDCTGSTMTGYGILNGPYYGIKVEGDYNLEKLGPGRYKVRVSGSYTFGDLSDLNDDNPHDVIIKNVIFAGGLATTPHFDSSIKFPADGQFVYDSNTGKYVSTLGWPFGFSK